MFNGVTVDHDLLDQMDGIYHNYHEAEIHPSKYESRISLVSRIYDALEKHGICSICGNGATSLVEKLNIYVKSSRIFGRIAMVTVSENPDLEEIKDDIIQQIQIESIRNCILILDGFWWVLSEKDLELIGIPSQKKSIKIVYTSIDEDMCKNDGNHPIFRVDYLEDVEAWDLFTKIAGNSIVALDLLETARQIVNECDGFCILILTIAFTLKDRPADVWKDFLTSLQNLNRTHISDMEKVFSLFRLSYDLLNDKEARQLFCVCCLFPEEFDIPIEDLVLFGKGLKLFENVDSMHQARERVECLIHELKSSYLLLDGDEDDTVKVHDMVRDFGVWMFSKMEHPYVARCENDLEEWPLKRTEYQKCSAISFVCKTMEKHPVDLNCPNLHLLQFSYGSDSARLPNAIFQGLQNLRVLSVGIPSLSHQLIMLQKLRTLCITETISDNRYRKPRPRIGDLLGEEMKDLEIFSFSTARPYDDFPREIGLLHNLRFLRFNRDRIKYIPPGVLSKLVRLEEVYLPLDFISWGRREEGGERMNASLSETESLVQLIAIRIGVQKGSILAKKLVKKLTRFHVFIGSHVSHDYEFRTSGNLKKILEVFDIDADDFRVSWINTLVLKADCLRLKQVRNLKNIITRKPKQDKNIEFPQWKKICISDCKEMEYVASGQIPLTSFSQLEILKLFGLCNLRAICLSKFEGLCFGNLCEIQIMFCNKLKHVFSVSVATQLRQLQSLQICFCDEMEAIFYREHKNNDGEIQLRDPRIHHKSKLISLIHSSVAKRLFGRGKQPKMDTSQQQMEESIGKEDEQDLGKDETIFPQLKTIELAYMDKLRVFYDANHGHAMLMPSLESLSIFRCNHLEGFCHALLKTPLLRKIEFNGNRYSAKGDLNAFVKNMKWSAQSFSS